MAAALAAALLALGCAGSKARGTEREALAALQAKRARQDSIAAGLTRNDTGKTLVSRVNFDDGYETSYLVVTRSGARIVVDPFMIPASVEADLVLSTHKDYDHNDPDFYRRLPGAVKSLYALGTVEFEDVRATGIPASHNGDDFDPALPSDVIYLVEADGLRLAFLGDICQTRLTEAQLAALGRVDVAFIPMSNAPSYGYEAARSLAMLRQLDPRLAFPVHPTDKTVKEVAAGLGGLVEAPCRFAIGTEELAPGPTRVVRLARLSPD